MLPQVDNRRNLSRADEVGVILLTWEIYGEVGCWAVLVTMVSL